jgi:hypothetical protein
MSEVGGTLRLMSSECPAEATTGAVDQGWLDELSPWLHGENPSALTILPERIVEGKAVFNADIAPLAKQIRSQGYDAQLLSTPSQTFRSEYGADSLIVVSILLNVAGSATWDSFKFLLHVIKVRVRGIRDSGAEPRLTLAQGIFRYPDGSSYLWQKFSGAPEHVVNLAESALRDYMTANDASEHRAVESGEDTNTLS